MSAVNPYNPPLAEVADVHVAPSSYGPLKLWSAAGRIGRLRYLAWTMGASLIMMLVIGVMTAALAPMMGADGAAVAMVVGYLPMLVFIVLALIQRTHDMGWSGWMCLLAFVPLVGLIWVFKAGTPGANAYGAPPPPNTTGVKVLAWVMPALVIIGMLAAIALPAYSDYAKRARAAQMSTQPAPAQQQ